MVYLQLGRTENRTAAADNSSKLTLRLTYYIHSQQVRNGCYYCKTERGSPILIIRALFSRFSISSKAPLIDRK
ncbi:hypothetical protein ANTRET_LOCUS5745 [Anthophora retusa]